MKPLFPNTILQSIGLIIIGVLFSTPILFLTESKYLNFSADIKNTFLYIILCSMIIGLTYFINKRRKTALDYNFKVSTLLPIPLLMACVCFFQIGLNVPTSQFLTATFNSGAAVKNPLDQMTILIGSLIIGPILEEIIYRGIILKGLLTSHSPKFAILASSIIFAVSHGKPIQILGALVIGLFLGWIYYKTKSLGTTIILHFTANLTSQLAIFINFKNGILTNTGNHLIYGNFTYPIIITFCLLFGISFYYLYRKIKPISL